MVICCGEALMDMVLTSFPENGNGFLPLPGGCSYNTSIAIGRLGVPVQFLGKISTDFFGDILIKRLRENNVGDNLIVRTELNTTLAFINVCENQTHENQASENQRPQYSFYIDGTSAPMLFPANLPSVLPAQTSCIVFGSISMNMEPAAVTIEDFINRYQSDDSPLISFDPNIRPFMIKNREMYIENFERWVSASVIVKLSAEDAEYVYPGFEPEKVLSKILSLGTRLAICTLGQDGSLAMLRCNDESIITASAPAIETTLVDTVGAGDTFHGAFLVWLQLRGKLSRSALSGLSEFELYDALYFSNKAASFVCSRHGADPPWTEELR